MILFLQSNLGEIDFISDLDAAQALENILSSAFQGSHVVISSPETTQSILKNSDFGIKSRSVLKKIENWFPQLGSLSESLPYHVLVDAQIDLTQKLSKTSWKVPLKAFVHSSLSVESTLLSENITDCELLSFAGKHYKIKKKLKGVELKLKMVSGGGATTYQTLNTIAQNKSEFCICITDSDKFSKEASCGETSRQCARVASETDWVLDHVSTQVRELENVIPLRFLDEALTGELLVKWEAFKESKKVLHELVGNYADLKEGVSLGWVLKLKIDTPERKFWETIATDISHKNGEVFECLTANKCEIHPETSGCEECQILNPIAKNLLASVLQWLSLRSPQDTAKFLTEDDSTEWLELGMRVLSFCVGAPKYRS